MEKEYNQYVPDQENVRMNHVSDKNGGPGHGVNGVHMSADVQGHSGGDRYREILQEQIKIKERKNDGRWRMDRNIKGMNYDDLQGYKEWDAVKYNSSLPHSHVDSNVANAVINKFKNMNDIGVSHEEEYLYNDSVPMFQSGKVIFFDLQSTKLLVDC
jgi:hypothetical protein